MKSAGNGARVTVLGFAAACLACPAAAVAEDALPSDQEQPVQEGNRQHPDAVRGAHLCAAIKRDDAEALLGLLETVDVDDAECAPMLHEAAYLDSWQSAKVLLDAGFDANLGVYKPPLHFAAKHGSPRVAALLIEYGAEVNARDDIGWTPLHYALVKGSKRPGLQTAKMLLERGADVNAATAAVGWTPLHLAAHLSGVGYAYGYDGPDVLDIVQQLIERGADVGARTRVGAWSPAWVAKASEDPGDDLEASASSQAVLAAIQAAGGKDEGCDAPRYRQRSDAINAVPNKDIETQLARDIADLARFDDEFFAAAAEHRPEVSQTLQEAETRLRGLTPGCEYNLPFAVPGVLAGGYRVAGGSFTAPGAEEALQFAGYDIMDGGYLLSLEDRHGMVRPITTVNYHRDYKGLCLDRQTNTHAAVFTRPHGGNCCEWSDTFYYQYDAEAGNLVLVFVDHRADEAKQPTGKNAECLWRAAEAERDDHRRAAVYDDKER